MNYKKVLPLAAALILGLISARMVVQIIHGRAAETAAGPKLLNVVTAARDITAGEALQQDALTVGQIVADSSSSATFSQPAQIFGRVVTAPLVKGQAVVETLLAPVGAAAGLQAVIPAGMRAVTIDVNEESGVAGYVTPGCRVDLLQTVHTGPTNQILGRCLVQNVVVTAVGSRGETADAGPAHSVTLLLTPQQAELIELASANGHTRLVLRGSQDNQLNPISPMTMVDLTGEKGATLQDLNSTTQTAGRDPFAAATQPAVALSGWKVRVVAAGESSLVSVDSTPISAQPAVTNTDVRPITGQ